MNISQIVFSPTGGTRRVTDAITKVWEMPIREIDLTNAETDYSAFCLEENEIAVIAVPSYGGRVPDLAIQRISKIRGRKTRCVIVCVYGNRAYEDTLMELRDIVEKNGFKVIAAVAAIAEHSIIRQYASGRPDAEDKKVLQIYAKEILEKIKRNSPEDSALQIPGNHPYKKSGGAGLVPKANKNCIRCGLCAEKCPAQAISRENPENTDNKKCISCMRCVAQCPQSARRTNGAMVSLAALAIKKACSARKENELYI